MKNDSLVWASLFFFVSLGSSIWAVAWLISKQIDGWGWLLIVIVIIFGGIRITNKPTNATCPKCKHYFKVEEGDEDAE